MLLSWAVQSSHAHDYLDTVFPSNEVIIEAMSGVEPPWEEIQESVCYRIFRSFDPDR